MSRLSAAAALALCCLCAASVAGAQPQANIERNLPVTFEDTKPEEFLGREVQTFGRYERTEDGENRWRVEPRLEVGIWWNTQITVGVPFLFGGADKDAGLAPVEVDLLYNFNRETLDLPALALAVGAEFAEVAKVGDADGVDPFVRLVIDRTVGGTWVRHEIHLNVTYQHNLSRNDMERRGRYEAVLGYSVPLGSATLLVTDVVRAQDMMKDVEHNLFELGVRQALTPQTILTAGAGAGAWDESPRVRGTVGLQYEF